jgi:two-component system, chemotaxis family, chemotaxis protein CheY
MMKNILTVDDSASMRQVISLTLTTSGYNVIEAVDGGEALTKLESNTVHMVIADINMPNMDGIELLRLIKENPAHRFIPVLMLTTESSLHLKRDGKTAGAAGWIVKPFRPDQLVSVVRKVLG